MGIKPSVGNADNSPLVEQYINTSYDVVKIVSDNIGYVQAVGNDIANVNLVAVDISSVIIVAGDIVNVSIVAADIINVNAVAAAIANINIVANDIANVNTVSADIANVNTVAGNIANVNLVGADITNVNLVAADLTNIDIAAGDITNINIVATNITNVNTVAANIGDVNIVENEITNGNIALAIAAPALTEADKTEASNWAKYPEDSLVPEGNLTDEYSSLHWAKKSQLYAVGSLKYKGAYDASLGVYPSSPVLGDYYKITVAGTIAPYTLAVGDSIIYNGVDWDKIDSTEQVTSVAGAIGAVTAAQLKAQYVLEPNAFTDALFTFLSALDTAINTSAVGTVITLDNAGDALFNGNIAVLATIDTLDAANAYAHLSLGGYGEISANNSEATDIFINSNAWWNSTSGVFESRRVTAGFSSQIKISDQIIFKVSNGTNTRGTDLTAAFVTALILDNSGNAIFSKRVEVPYITESNVVAAPTTAYAINPFLGSLFQLTLGGNTAISFSNIPSSGKALTLTLVLIQDATGSRVPSFPASVKWDGGTIPTWGTVAGDEDVVTMFTYDGGTTWRANLVGQNYA